MKRVLIAASLAVLASCARTEEPGNQADPALTNVAVNDALAADGNAAAPANSAALLPAIEFVGTGGQSLGQVSAADGPAGLILTLAATGLPPGVHGIHLHAVGTCEGPKFESAGGHWNPDSKQHGSANPAGPHRGDLPNITAAPDGSASEPLVVAGVTLAHLRDADGTALVIHANADDNKTDPSGNSGDRIACAVLAPAG